jgi:hypothetical protein
MAKYEDPLFMDPSPTSKYSREWVTSQRQVSGFMGTSCDTQLVTPTFLCSARLPDGRRLPLSHALRRENAWEALNQMADAINAIIESNREDME